MRDGTKEVLALRSGYRESVESWSEVLRDLKARGIEAPRLLMADGNAAIWGAVRLEPLMLLKATKDKRPRGRGSKVFLLPKSDPLDLLFALAPMPEPK